MKWNEMSERARDRLVAEEIMGYTVRAQGTYDGGFAHVEGKRRPAYYLFDAQGETDWRKECASPEEAWRLCPHFTTSMDAAWLVVEKINEPIGDGYRRSALIYARFIEELEKIVGSDMFFDLFYCEPGGNHLTPERICLAAHRAVGCNLG